MLPEVAANISAVEINNAEGGDFESFQFVGAYTKDKNSEVISKQGVETVGKLTMQGWFEAVGASKAMVGLLQVACVDQVAWNWGAISITFSYAPHSNSWYRADLVAFDGLCQGTPFINVIKHWDRKDPENRKQWRTQHDPLLALGPPYVYHVVSLGLAVP
jgi:hypothetical protein